MSPTPARPPEETALMGKVGSLSSRVLEGPEWEGKGGKGETESGGVTRATPAPCLSHSPSVCIKDGYRRKTPALRSKMDSEMREEVKNSLRIKSQRLDPAGPEAELPLDFSGD